MELTTDETTRPSTVKQLNSKQLNTFHKFNINEKYVKYEMKCQELQQTLYKVYNWAKIKSISMVC